MADTRRSRRGGAGRGAVGGWLSPILLWLLPLATGCAAGTASSEPAASGPAEARARSSAEVGNPIVRGLFTADPAALVHGDTLYLFTGRDEATLVQSDFVMREWHGFSTIEPAADPARWTHHGALLSLDDFDWADANAWASEVVRGRDGRFYWFVSARWADAPEDGDRMAIGVAVADHPLGPYRDAIGAPLVTARVPNASDHNIDPTVLVADEGVYLYWGSFWSPRVVRLRASMTELDGAVETPDGLPGFWEAPWVFERDGLYYMVYASNRNLDDDCVESDYYACIRYSTASHPAGLWRPGGILLGQVSSTTSHPAVIEFPEDSDRWWLVYHTADLPEGGNFRRSVAIDPLVFGADGIIRRVVQTRYEPSEPEPRPTANASLSASLRCSYTSPWESCEALAGEAEPAGSDAAGPLLGTRWATWPEAGEQWVEYSWERPVRLHAAEAYWFQDTPDGAQGGVKRPASWTLEYRTDDGWTPVRTDGPYGTALDRLNRVTFDPVTTTAIRARLSPRPDAGGVGAFRVRVYSPTPAEVERVAVSTVPGQTPALPATVELRYSDGAVIDAPVHWRDPAPSALERPGTFEITGVVEASPVEARAAVTVLDPGD